MKKKNCEKNNKKLIYEKISKFYKSLTHDS